MNLEATCGVFAAVGVFFGFCSVRVLKNAKRSLCSVVADAAGAELLSGKPGDWRLGKFRSGFSRLPFFVPFGMEKMYRKYHRVKQKVNFWVISQSPVHKILQDENFCGIIYEIVNTQARGSTPPRSINRSRQHRTDCTVCVFALPDEIRTVQDWLKRNPRRR